MTTPPRRILFVSGTAYLPHAITGENVSVHALCRRLRAQGYDPIVLCAADAAAGDDFSPGYPLIRVPDPLAAMREMAARLEPYAIVVRGPWPAIDAAQWAAARGRRLHVNLASISFARAFPPPRAAPQVRYAACSSFLARLGQAFVGTEVAHVPPLIEPDDYRCTPAGDAILFVNPVPEKGAHLVAALAARLPHRHFLVARSWPDHPRHPPVSMPLPNVELADRTGDMRPLYARARLVLMPSMWEESLGRVVIEAQLSGIPAVTSDRGGLPEAVGRGGVVLPIGAPITRWCDAIERAFNDRGHYAALARAAGREGARPAHAPDAVVARFLDFVAS